MNGKTIPAAHRSERLAVLDFLRALAILLVLARHSLRPYWTDFGQPFLPAGGFDFAPLLLNGWIGVDLFFVLSGFLITQQLIPLGGKTALARRAHTGKYLKKRFFRIAPAYYLVLTLVCLGLFPPYPDDPAHVWGWRYVYHLLFLNDYFPSNIVVVFWSLAIEMKFYLVAPFLVLFLLRRTPGRRALFLALLFVLVIMLRYETALALAGKPMDYNSYFALIRNRFHLTLDGLLAGMFCALLWNEAKARKILEGKIVSAMLLGAGAALLLALAAPAPLVDIQVSLFDKVLLPSCIALGFAMIMLGALGRWGNVSAKKSSVISFIALISYSLYLVHMLFLQPASIMGARLFHPQSAQGEWLASLLPFLILSGLSATALYYCVEKPFNRMARK